MRHYNGLTINARIYTACCGAYVLSADGRERRKSSQIVPGEVLTCEGCGEQDCDIVEEEEAWDDGDWD